MPKEFGPYKTPPPETRPPVHAASKPSPLITVLRVAILLMLAMFIVGNIGNWAPLYELRLIHTFTKWWNGYPYGDVGGIHPGHASSVMDTGPFRNITHTGHTEMVRPTFLFFFCILPFFFGVLLIEALHMLAPARRLTHVWLWRMSAYLRRKPRIPFLGVSRFTFGEWLFGIVFVIGGNALCFWYQWDRRIKIAQKQVKTGKAVLDTAKYFNIVGISCAYIAIYNLSFLLLPVTRNCVWMEFFNVSYANAVKFHRWIGFMTVITAVVHMTGYWVKWTLQGTFMKYQLPCTRCNISDEYTGYYAWFNTFGFISVLAMLLMIPTSLPIVRRKMYEWFYVSHWVLFVIAYFFAILHWGQILWWLLPAGVLFLISRATSSWNGLAPVVVRSFGVVSGSGDSSISNPDDELIKLVIERSARLALSHDYKVGQFVYINVPHISKLQWHALTIASSPLSSPTELTLLIKPLGDWSKKLAAYAKECEAAEQTPIVYMDGYCGSSLEHYDEYGALCLVGGGIGVTPLLAILEDIAAKVVKAGSVWTQPRVVFVLVFRELALLRSMALVLLKLKELDPHGEFFQSQLYCSRPPPDEALDAMLDHRSNEKTAQGTIGKKLALDAGTARAFYEPLRSSAKMRLVMFVTLFGVAMLVLTGARWGNGFVQGDNHPKLWPLQRAYEFIACCSVISVVFAFLFYEHWMIMKRGINFSDKSHYTMEVPDLASMASAAGVYSMRDLASHLDVVFGERPDIRTVLKETLAIHQETHATLIPLIGVYVSGPTAMKTATNEAVVELGSGCFDVHEEEFEL